MKSKQSVESSSPMASALSTHMPKMPAGKRAKSGADESAVKRELDPQKRHEYVRTAAYYRAQHRGFAQNHELEDWFAAEEEVDERLH